MDLLRLFHQYRKQDISFCFFVVDFIVSNSGIAGVIIVLIQTQLHGHSVCVLIDVVPENSSVGVTCLDVSVVVDNDNASVGVSGIHLVLLLI